MHRFIDDLIANSAVEGPDRTALSYRDTSLTYSALDEDVNAIAAAYRNLGLRRADRVAVYLPKQLETISALFGAARAGGAFVPVNPVLKAPQVAHILSDGGVRILVTSADRLTAVAPEIQDCHELTTIIIVGLMPESAPPLHQRIVDWAEVTEKFHGHKIADRDGTSLDMAAILYTSGSTGAPKGVVLSHANLLAGAESVAEYLHNVDQDRLLAVLPLSFDYGLNQLTTTFRVGAEVRLLNYLLPRDIPRAVAEHGITGLACVPPLWIQLAEIDWPDEAVKALRYLTSTGGRMPHKLVMKLKEIFPTSDIYLMYGLTEAFRSTYLDPALIEEKPNSIGKAIPGAEIMVVRPDGTECQPDEPGELVHRGPHVALGYWGDPERTAKRFRPAPGRDTEIPITEYAVWSGDMVKKDKDGFLYFVGRNDDMIKTSGFRVSPTEIEECVHHSHAVGEVAAVGTEDEQLGQRVVIVVTKPADADRLDRDAILARCKVELPSYMVPSEIIEWDSLPRNPNGKVDRGEILRQLLETKESRTA